MFSQLPFRICGTEIVVIQINCICHLFATQSLICCCR